MTLATGGQPERSGIGEENPSGREAGGGGHVGGPRLGDDAEQFCR
jgi:hypothetical protein